MTWARGRDVIDRLLREGELDSVAASTDVAAQLLTTAQAHVTLAALGVDDDPAGALQLSYDAARKASAALLAIQGLRATTRGGHIAVIDAVRAQFNDRGGVEVFGKLNRLRRRRNDSEYPSADSPGVTRDDARDALETARTTIAAAQNLIDSGRLDPFA